ncbi:hypothetical protein CKO44_12030 [Rubrivivax gelatinosus]|uniref:TSUP family transporter n=1 Tax=Rubrivivax gelatinosus TaxID=28068 RepID=UPI0019080E66|nr:hypothetical protein [Rubrivivax gelatinosus]
MEFGVLLVAELLALGVATGFVAGLLGVGGGMTMVPFLTAILSHRGVEGGLAVKMAIATSMATIVFTSLSSVRAHHRHGAVRWDYVRGIAPGIVLGGLASGAGIFALAKGRGLALFFAVFIGFSALQMLRGRQPRASRVMPGAAGQAGVGSVIGLVSGLLGAGGGFLSVPFMSWCNVPLRQAIATSAALGFPIAVANVAGYLIAGRSLPPALPGAFGYLYLPALVIVALASVTLAPLGARCAQRMDPGRLRRIFALLLFALAAYMATRAF